MNSARKDIDFSNLALIIDGMAEDSSAASMIIDELLETKGEMSTLATLIILDDMNIRGVQITTLYKIANQDIEKFYEKAISMKEKDVEKLNYETFAICKYKAIYDGSKEDREKNPEKYIFTDEERSEIRNEKSRKRAQDMIIENQKKTDDLTPSISSKEAIKIISSNGFTCGYKKEYENEEGKTIIYRVFHNDFGDILYTHSLKEPDIFLYGQSKLNIIRKNTIQEFEKVGCNAYINVDGVVGYNIELKEKPFEKYIKILKRNEPIVDNIKRRYFDSNLFPIIESVEGIKYREKRKTYESLVISEIYNLLTFKETYIDLDSKLKHIYKSLLPFSEERAYDEIIFQLNTDRGIDVVKKIEKVLGIKLNKEQLKKAKNRFCKLNNKHFNVNSPKFISSLVGKDTLGKELDKRIEKVLNEKIPN